MASVDEDERQRINAALGAWRQGDFNDFALSLMRRMSSKHDKNSEEGRALRALREIRVHAAPSWDADTVELMFWFIRNPDEPSFEGRGWDHYLDAWLNMSSPVDDSSRWTGSFRRWMT